MEFADDKTRVLVVDDDPDIRDVVMATLEDDGYALEQVEDGALFAKALDSFEPDLVVLDIEVGSPNGLELLEKMRRAGDHRAVVLLTSRAEESDRIRGLDLGADDYVTKPFSVKELASRIRAVLRRHRMPTTSSKIEFGSLHIDPVSRKVMVDGAEIYFTRIEFGVLEYFATNPGKAVSRKDLLQKVWGSQESWQDPETVTEHVRRLRVKLREAGVPDAITTLRGVGYRFDSSMLG